MSDKDILDRRFAELAATNLPVPAPGQVVARGRQRRRRARTQAISAAVAAVTIVAVGVTQLPRPHQAIQPGTKHHRLPAAVCTAAPDAALQRALQHDLPVSRQSAVTPIALSPDGTDLYLETTVPGFHGIAEESVATGAIIRRIEQLPADYNGAQGVLAPDGDLLWSTTYPIKRGYSYGTTPVQLWSPHTGKVATLEPGHQGGAALSPPVLDAVRDVAAWEQKEGGKQEIVVDNLAVGQPRVIAVGYLGPPVFVGDALVWPAASTAGGPASHLLAAPAGDLSPGQRIAVPVPLRGVSEGALMGSGPAGSWATPISLIASDGQQTAYYSPDLMQLYYSSSLSQPARLVLSAPGGSSFAPGPPILGNGYLGWGTDDATNGLASTSTLAAAAITNGNTTWGSMWALGNYVFVNISPPVKKAHLDHLYLLNGSTIAGLRCASSGKSRSR
jgi:hypothetical protein